MSGRAEEALLIARTALRAVVDEGGDSAISPGIADDALEQIEAVMGPCPACGGTGRKPHGPDCYGGHDCAASPDDGPCPACRTAGCARCDGRCAECWEWEADCLCGPIVDAAGRSEHCAACQGRSRRGRGGSTVRSAVRRWGAAVGGSEATCGCGDGFTESSLCVACVARAEAEAEARGASVPRDVREYLDAAIAEWRQVRDDPAADPEMRRVAPLYVDAFQSARVALLGAVLPEGAGRARGPGPEAEWSRETLELEYRKTKNVFRQVLETYECRRPMPDDPDRVCAMPKGHAGKCWLCVRFAGPGPHRVLVVEPPPGDCPACGSPRDEARCGICGCEETGHGPAEG